MGISLLRLLNLPVKRGICAGVDCSELQWGIGFCYLNRLQGYIVSLIVWSSGERVGFTVGAPLAILQAIVEAGQVLGPPCLSS